MTWVDIYFTCNMNPLSYKTKCDMDLDLTPYPKLQALVERVNAHPRIADWLRVRPQTKSWHFSDTLELISLFLNILDAQLLPKCS